MRDVGPPKGGLGPTRSQEGREGPRCCQSDMRNSTRGSKPEEPVETPGCPVCFCGDIMKPFRHESCSPKHLPQSLRAAFGVPPVREFGPKVAPKTVRRAVTRSRTAPS